MVEMVLEAAPATAPQPSPRTRGGCQKDLPTDSTAPFETFHGRGVRGADRSPQSSGTRKFALRVDPSPRNYSRFEVNYVAHPLMFRVALSCILVEFDWYHPN